jgi:hypothetical protein
LHLVRLGLLLKISASSKELVSRHAGGEDVVFLEEMLTKHKKEFNSALLTSLLNAYAMMNSSPIPELPIEMAISELEK